VDVDAGVVDAQLHDRQHRHHGEGFVDFPQIHIGHTPAGFCQNLADRAARGQRELARMLAVGAVADNADQRLQAQCIGLALLHQHQCRGAVGNRAGVGGGHRAVFGECRLQLRNFFDVGIARLLIGINKLIALARRYRDRNDFILEPAIVDGSVGTLQRFDRKGIHLLAGNAFFIRDFLSKRTHQAAGFGILQAIQKHVIEHLAVAHTGAVTVLVQYIGSIGHRLHAASDHDLTRTGNNLVMGEHGGAHAGAAQLVDGDRASGIRQAGQTHGLPGRALLQAGGQARQAALKAAHGGTGAVNDNNWILAHASTLGSGAG